METRRVLKLIFLECVKTGILTWATVSAVIIFAAHQNRNVPVGPGKEQGNDPK